TAAAGAVAAGAGVVAPAAGALDPPIAATALLQADESDELCCCRHERAACPPGCTPEHCAMKSLRQLDLMAFCWAAVGCCAYAVPTRSVSNSIPAATNAPNAAALRCKCLIVT